MTSVLAVIAGISREQLRLVVKEEGGASITKKHLSELSKRDDFPRKVRLGQQAIGWRIQDIEAWIDSKMVDSAHVDGGQNDNE